MNHLFNNLHIKTAFNGHPLGTCFAEIWPTLPENITKEDIMNYTKQHFTANRLILSGASVDHDQLVNLAEKYFSKLPPSNPSIIDVPVAYTGGEFYQPLPQKYMLNPNYKEHVVIAFKGEGWKHRDSFVVALLGKILGGGTSFSAGGPGKGMFSRNYVKLMNVMHWIESAETLMFTYRDVSIFGIVASCQPGQIRNLFEEVCKQIRDLVLDPLKDPASFDAEIQRAKNQLKSTLFTNLEQKSVLFDDIGRQVLIYDKYHSASELCQIIDSITVEDCCVVGQKLLESVPTVVGLYDPRSERNLVSFDTFQKFFTTIFIDKK